MSSLSAFFSQTSIKQFITEKPQSTIITCQETDILPEVMEKLAAHKILSVPVLRNDEYVGIIGAKEIIKFIADLHWNLLDAPKLTREASIYVDFNQALVNEVMSRKSVKVHDTADFKVAIQTMIQADLHRLPVVDGNGKIVHIFTDTDVVQLLHSNPDPKYATKVSEIRHVAELLSSLKAAECTTDDLFVPLERIRRQDAKLTDLFLTIGTPTTLTHSVNTKTKAIEAFRVLLGSNITAVPIVDEHGVLQHAITIRDIRRIAMNAEHINVLYEEDCLTFAKRTFDRSLSADFADDLSTISVTLNDSVKTIIDRLYNNKIFRVWVVDDKKRPIMTVTLQDVISLVLSA